MQEDAPTPDADTPQPLARLEEAASRTHTTIAAVAGAQYALDDVRRNHNASAADISRAATTFRNLEQQLNQDIAAEVAAHIAVLEDEINKQVQKG